MLTGEMASSNRPVRLVMPVLIVVQVRPALVDLRMPPPSTQAYWMLKLVGSAMSCRMLLTRPKAPMPVSV